MLGFKSCRLTFIGLTAVIFYYLFVALRDCERKRAIKLMKDLWQICFPNKNNH